MFNAGGRLGFSAWADYMKDRKSVYQLIFAVSILFTAVVLVTGGITRGSEHAVLALFVLAMIFIVNAGYGGGFSNIPTLLSDHYGMSSISAIHGITLSAWAFAGLTGNQMASAIVERTGAIVVNAQGIAVNPSGYQNVLYVTGALYCVSLLLCTFLVKPSKNQK